MQQNTHQVLHETQQFYLLNQPQKEPTSKECRNVLIPLQDLQDMARQLERLLEAETRAGKETTGKIDFVGCLASA